MSEASNIRDFIQGSIRAEKARRNWTFADLSAALRAQGIEQSATNLSTKVGRGDMSAQLFLAVMKVLGQDSVDLRGLQLGSKPAARRRGA